ncbi:MAG: hypothetical protein U0T81_09985 [Saprospiraceae bacterium]
MEREERDACVDQKWNIEGVGTCVFVNNYEGIHLMPETVRMLWLTV